MDNSKDKHTWSSSIIPLPNQVRGRRGRLRGSRNTNVSVPPRRIISPPSPLPMPRPPSYTLQLIHDSQQEEVPLPPSPNPALKGSRSTSSIRSAVSNSSSGRSLTSSSSKSSLAIDPLPASAAVAMDEERRCVSASSARSSRSLSVSPTRLNTSSPDEKSKKNKINNNSSSGWYYVFSLLLCRKIKRKRINHELIILLLLLNHWYGFPCRFIMSKQKQLCFCDDSMLPMVQLGLFLYNNFTNKETPAACLVLWSACMLTLIIINRVEGHHFRCSSCMSYLLKATSN